MGRCEDEQMWRWADVKMSRCEDKKMWRWADVKMSRCEDEQMWRWEDVKMSRCEDEQVWRWADVKMRRCEDKKMWRWADVKSRCEDEQMWWEGVKMSRCEDGKVWRWADVKMRGCEDERMWRWDDVKMRCEDERMWRWDVKMRRCFTDPHYWKNPARRRSREKTMHHLLICIMIPEDRFRCGCHRKILEVSKQWAVIAIACHSCQWHPMALWCPATQSICHHVMCYLVVKPNPSDWFHNRLIAEESKDIKGFRILASVIFGSSLWYRAKSIKALTALTQIETDISRCKQTA